MPPPPTITEQLRKIVDAPEKLIRIGDPIIDPFREAITRRNGGSYIGLVRTLRTMDSNGDKKLSPQEFHEGLAKFQLNFRREEVERLFKLLDKDGNGTLSIEEFVRGIRPEMSMGRRDLVLQAFKLLDFSGDGVVSIEEMKGLYDATQHPAVLAGRKTVDQIMMEFIQDWDRNYDGVVTLKEFFEYYNNLSSSIDSDQYFELMIRNAWHLSGGEGIAKNTTCLRVLVTYEDGRQGVVEVKNDLRVNKNDMNAIKEALVKQGVKGIKAISKNGQV